MIYINKTPEANGAHDNFETNEIIEIDGWLIVPAELESKTRSLLPFIIITTDNGAITAVENNESARERWQAEHPEPEPQLDDITALQLAVAELAETQAADQTANELALAELAEIVLGG